MKLMSSIGKLLFYSGLLVFLLSLGTGSFQLSQETAFDELDRLHLEDGRSYYSVLEPELKSLYGKEFSSRYAFLKAYRESVDRTQEELKKQSGLSIKDDRSVMILKRSTTGLLRNDMAFAFVFSFVFLLMPIGAVLMFYAKYKSPVGGIRHNGIFQNSLTNGGWLGIFLGTLLIGFYIVLYFFPEWLTNWMLLADPIKQVFIAGAQADQWFLYGLMYGVAMLVMGLRMYMKYRGNRYQMFRTTSVLFFQLCFAFALPEILAAFNQPAVDLKHIWPLNYGYFEGSNITSMYSYGNIGMTMFWWGVLLFLIGVPLFTYFFGKRWYCSWVCGCGGLAETAGDSFRQLSDKSVKAWRIERIMIHAVLVFAVLMTVLVLCAYWGIGNTPENPDMVFGISSGTLKWIYGFLIGSIFSGVVGTGFYPLMGNRVWCRFGCPLAAYIGLFQRKKSRFRITTNGGQCISCGNCSTYCEMGIDVRAYAQKGQNIVRSSCVGCGVCSAVCPRGVLRLENAPEETRMQQEPIVIGHDGIRLNEKL